MNRYILTNFKFIVFERWLFCMFKGISITAFFSKSTTETTKLNIESVILVLHTALNKNCRNKPNNLNAVSLWFKQHLKLHLICKNQQ